MLHAIVHFVCPNMRYPLKSHGYPWFMFIHPGDQSTGLIGDFAQALGESRMSLGTRTMFEHMKVRCRSQDHNAHDPIIYLFTPLVR